MTTTSHRTGQPPPRFPRLRHFAVEYLVALPLGVAVALAWSALDPETYFRLAHSASFAVNDVAMVFFFGLMTKEVVEATLPGGALHPWRRAALPVVASFAASLLTVALFLWLVRVFGEPMLARGWASILAVDVAAGYFVARLIFGRSAIVPFFLGVSLAANAIGFVALALSEPAREARPIALLAALGLAIVLAWAGRLRRIESPWYYLLVAGSASWTGLYLGGVHPALALLPVVPFMPSARKDPGFFVDAVPGAHDALSRLELVLRHPAQLALFLFGAVNAGLVAPTIEAGMLALPIAALVGRPLGLLIGAAAGRAIGLHLPAGVRPRDLAVLGIATAVGFTMTLFFATAALGPGQTLSELRAGALMTLLFGVAALAAARLLHVGAFARIVRRREV
jgi:NhaA family Na+:H+ antiporter